MLLRKALQKHSLTRTFLQFRIQGESNKLETIPVKQGLIRLWLPVYRQYTGSNLEKQWNTTKYLINNYRYQV